MVAPDRPRRFPWGIFIAALVIILLLAGAPVFSVLLAGLIAESNDCTLHEGFRNPCVINGEDWGGTLYAMFVMGWLMLATIPLGIIAIGIWAVVLALAVWLHKRKTA